MATSTLLSLVLVASAPAAEPTSPAPADMHLRYEWKEASLPPPYHYEYTLELGPGPEGRIDFWPDYPGGETPVWHERFRIDPERWRMLETRLSALGVGTVPEAPTEIVPVVGGRLARLELDHQGHSHAIEGGVEEGKLAAVHSLILELVPAELWSRLRERRQAYHAHPDPGQVH